MNKIGIFFGTETGTTRLIAKKIHKLLGDELADKPVNVNRITPADMLKYDALILGTPSYGVGQIPGKSAGCLEPNWEEFLVQMDNPDFAGKRIAFFGLGAQERYADRFASSLMALYNVFQGYGADIVADDWANEGYTFNHSDSLKDGKFVGLVIDQRTQGMYTEERLAKWVEQVRPLLMACVNDPEIAADFLIDEAATVEPALRVIERLDNPPEFPDIEPAGGLKALVFQRDEDANAP